MKFSIVLALVAAATAVSAETNAQRFARGLAPNGPAKRATPVEAARRHKPSGGSGQCNTGPVNCCNNVSTPNEDGDLLGVLQLLGLDGIDGDTHCGTSCSTLVGSTCSDNQQPVCCENNDYNGIVNIGCSPINIL